MPSPSVTKALSPDQIAAATTAPAAPKPEPALIAPVGVEVEREVLLTFPVRVGETVIESVTIKRLRGRDFARLRGQLDEDGTAVLSIMTSLPPDILGAMDADDFITLQEAAANFLPERLTAGPPTS